MVRSRSWSLDRQLAAVAIILISAALVAAYGQHRALAMSLIVAIALLLVAGTAIPVVVEIALEAATALAAVAAAGAPAALLLVVLALHSSRPLSAWMPAVALAPGVIASLAVTLGPRGNALRDIAIASALAGSGVMLLVDPVFARARANALVVRARELQHRRAESDRRVAGDAHDELASVTTTLEEVGRLLGRVDDPVSTEVLHSVENAIAKCVQARSVGNVSEYPDAIDASNEASSLLVERWGRPEKLPSWWPLALREMWAGTVGNWLDSIRYLHTREIERVALVGTFVLRAALVISLPLLGAITRAGVVPLSPHVADWRNAVWGLAAAWAGVVAAYAIPIAERAMTPPRRALERGIAALETLLAAALIVADPSWVTLAGSAVALNWWMRPRWRLRRLVAGVLSFTSLFVLAESLMRVPSPGWRVVLDVVVGLAVLFFISCSFGLMFPLVVPYVLFVIPSWNLQAKGFARRRWGERLGPVTAALRAASRAGASGAGSPAVAEILPQLLRVEAQVDRLRQPTHGVSREPLFRRRTLGQVIESGLERAWGDPVRPLRYASPTFAPLGLGAMRLRGWRDANRLEVALARIAAEALRHGDHEIRCDCVVDQGAQRVRLVIENDVLSGATLRATGEGSGGREIALAVEQLREGTVDVRRLEHGVLGVPVFVVALSFSTDLLDWEHPAAS